MASVLDSHCAIWSRVLILTGLSGAQKALEHVQRSSKTCSTQRHSPGPALVHDQHLITRWLAEQSLGLAYMFAWAYNTCAVVIVSRPETVWTGDVSRPVVWWSLGPICHLLPSFRQAGCRMRPPDAGMDDAAAVAVLDAGVRFYIARDRPRMRTAPVPTRGVRAYFDVKASSGPDCDIIPGLVSTGRLPFRPASLVFR